MIKLEEGMDKKAISECGGGHVPPSPVKVALLYVINNLIHTQVTR
jgi:hypothetical protein